MKGRKLKYRFHNPNTEEATANYIAKIMIEANAKKVEQKIMVVASQGEMRLEGMESNS